MRVETERMLENPRSKESTLSCLIEEPPEQPEAATTPGSSPTCDWWMLREE